MRLILPHYFVQRPAHQGRKAEQVVVRSWGEFEVPEASGKDAPVAVEWEFRHVAKSHPKLADRLRNEVYRHIDGRIYAKIGPVPGFFLASGTGGGEHSSATLEFVNALPRHPLAERALRLSIPVSDRPDGIRAASAPGRDGRVEDDDPARMEASAAHWARSLAVVDGSAWTVTAEPVVTVRIELGRRAVSVRFRDANADHRGRFVFRADHLAEARRFGAELASRLRADFDDAEDALHGARGDLLTFCETTGAALSLALSIGIGRPSAWPPSAAAIDVELEGLTLVAQDRRDADWGREFLRTYGRQRDSLPSPLPSDWGKSLPWLEQADLFHDFWLAQAAPGLSKDEPSCGDAP